MEKNIRRREYDRGFVSMMCADCGRKSTSAHPTSLISTSSSWIDCAFSTPGKYRAQRNLVLEILETKAVSFGAVEHINLLKGSHRYLLRKFFLCHHLRFIFYKCTVNEATSHV